MERIAEFVAQESADRLDVFLTRNLPGWSRSRLQKLIREGCVEIEGRVEHKTGAPVSSGERVRVRLRQEELHAVPEALPLEIIFEDADLVVVNKPAGMVVHAGAGVTAGTLVNALLHHIRELSFAGGEERPGIVHRLDKMTSGLILVAKNDFAHRELAAAFKSRAVHKRYTALVHGNMHRESGVIDATVGRDPVRRVRMRAGIRRGRDARTEYRVIERYPRFTLIEAFPLTGRTHQIRVHLASIGHPIAGDKLYGAPARVRTEGGEEITLLRNFLHASGLSFRHPRSSEQLAFECPLPKELLQFLRKIK